MFGPGPHEFTVSESAAVDTAVGTVTATDAEGSAVTYAITDVAIAEGEEEPAFAINETSGAITVARTLDYLVASSYDLTVAARDVAGGTATATVTVTVTGVGCANGTVITTPLSQKDLVRDCRVLLAAQEVLEGDTDVESQGGGTLDWSDTSALTAWEGVTTGGTPSRVTGLNLSSKSLTRTIPAGLGQLSALTTLNLSSNQLTGTIPPELGELTSLTELRLSGNTLTGCIPLALQSVATNDLSALNLLYCEPPAPTNLSAGTPSEVSVVLNWDAVTNAGTYRVEYREGDPAAWTTDSETITGATHTVDELQCETSYEFRVSAYGSGTTYAVAWGEPSAVFTTTTGACTPPSFVGAPYTFSVSESAAVDTPVGTVTATDAEGSAVTYAITDGAIAEGEEEPAFAINETSGAITVAAALDYETTSSYTLTVAASDPAARTSTVPVTVTVTDVVMDYDTDDDGLIEVADLAQLHAMRWGLDGNGFATDAGYALAFPDAATGMGCRTGCTGYELTGDLDFDTNGNGVTDVSDGYWNGGAGWEPVGNRRTRFTARFEGNGHTIANLFIARSSTDEVGLFGWIGSASVVRNVGLRATDVTGKKYVGGLVGLSAGTIRASYARGTVTGNQQIGGLVGLNDTTGTITASYAAGTVAGKGDSDNNMGGLVGRNVGAISASYATGAVAGNDNNSGNTGGLVGRNEGAISASYASGRVTGDHGSAGGLVGSRETGSTVTAGYWDTATSGQSTGGGGVGQTTSELQTPTAYSGIYAAWNVDIDGETGGDEPWDFGTADQYPALTVDFDGNGTATWEEFGEQRPAPVAARVDYDTDNDGLIEVASLAQLHAMRWDLDGNGFATDAGYALAFPDAPPGMGCRTGCTGYELTGDLDFDTNGNGARDVSDGYWNGGAGWEPVGNHRTKFTARFEGNGHTIANLFIARSSTDDVGLFGVTSSASVVRNVGLRATDVTGKDNVGRLVGKSAGTISASYARGTVAGNRRIGGLVGWNETTGTISASYAAGTVAGKGDHDNNMGGLVGRNVGAISASYATGAVAGNDNNSGNTGGLVGRNEGAISASYASGRVTGDHGSAGGLVGSRETGSTVTAGYWDTATSGQSTGGGGVGQTTSELQTPTAYSGIYAAWNVDIDGETGGDEPWDFGTADQYPALTVDFDGNGTATWEEFGEQRPAPVAARVDYDTDNDGLIEVASLAQLHAMRWDLDGNGFATDAGYALAFPDAPPGMGCRTGCTGYELTGDLDFDTNGNGARDVSDGYWNGGAGWEPVGNHRTKFTARFEGNGHTIANLFIARSSTDDVGLFGVTSSASVVRNVGLRATDVTGKDNVGGLVGKSAGTISASYARGTVAGNRRIGGLVGWNETTGTISASYAAGTVAGKGDHDNNMGGLVGWNVGAISASYATGAVAGNDNNSGNTGGLVGRHDGAISASYASGRVTGDHGAAGGLVGSKHSSSTVTAGYWDTATSGQSTGGGGVGQTTSALQTPTGYSGIYAAWNVDIDGVTGTDDPWDFGTADEYPALKVDFDGNGTATWEEFGEQRPRPDAPGNLSATAGDGRAVLTWDNPREFTITQYPIVKHQYQQNGGTWTDIPNSASGGANATSFAVTALTNGTAYSYAIRAMNIIGYGAASETVRVTPATGDYDTDDDGLIEVASLAQLHAMRWDLDGDGTATDPGYAAAFLDALSGMGCPATGCTGYELTGDLDFDTNGNGARDVSDGYWNGGAGWEPVGNRSTKFTATFEGNGHTIANLFIARRSTDDVGLFGGIGSASVVRNVGLRAIDVTGRNNVGGLVGWSEGTISASYASSSVSAGGDDVGGLVGRNTSTGTITTSYARGMVTGNQQIGGLVGRNVGTISAGYAAGAVTGSRTLGGLVGWNSSGTITVSYATGAVTAVSDSGGLIGRNIGGTVTASYWDTATSGQSTSSGGVGQTTSALQTPTAYSGIYAAWNVDIDGATGTDDPWDFGTADEYPALKVDFDGNGTATWQEFGEQRPAPDPSRVDYDTDNDGLLEVASLAQLHAMRWDLDGNGFATDAGYALAFPDAPPGMGCRAGCTGYELAQDLDFDTNGNGARDVSDGYWNGGAGWEPVGNHRTKFTGRFEGNGHTIANLFIARSSTDDVGLFGGIGSASVVRNVGLRAIDVTGRNNVGGLVGWSEGTISASYASSSVSAGGRRRRRAGGAEHEHGHDHHELCARHGHGEPADRRAGGAERRHDQRRLCRGRGDGEPHARRLGRVEQQRHDHRELRHGRGDGGQRQRRADRAEHWRHGHGELLGHGDERAEHRQWGRGPDDECAADADGLQRHLRRLERGHRRRDGRGRPVALRHGESISGPESGRRRQRHGHVGGVRGAAAGAGPLAGGLRRR